MAHSSSGLGHRPLKAEITGSNPVCATKAFITAFFVAKLARMAVSFCGFATNLLLMIFNKLIFTFRIKQSIKALRSRLLKSWDDVAISIKCHGCGEKVANKLRVREYRKEKRKGDTR